MNDEKYNNFFPTRYKEGGSWKNSSLNTTLAAHCLRLLRTDYRVTASWIIGSIQYVTAEHVLAEAHYKWHDQQNFYFILFTLSLIMALLNTLSNCNLLLVFDQFSFTASEAGSDKNLLSHESIFVWDNKYIYLNSVHSVVFFCLIDKMLQFPLVIFIITFY